MILPYLSAHGAINFAFIMPVFGLLDVPAYALVDLALGSVESFRGGKVYNQKWAEGVTINGKKYDGWDGWRSRAFHHSFMGTDEEGNEIGMVKSGLRGMAGGLHMGTYLGPGLALFHLPASINRIGSKSHHLPVILFRWAWLHG